MEKTEDLSINVEMSFNQIIDLADLMLENTIFTTPNMLTIRELAQSGLEKFKLLNYNNIK